MVNVFKKIVGKFTRRKDNEVRKTITGHRYISIDEGDSCLILKKDGKSVIIDSGSEQLSPSDEILLMTWCYLANPDFVKILSSMFGEIVDEVNRDKLNDRKTIGRVGVYAKSGDSSNGVEE